MKRALVGIALFAACVSVGCHRAPSASPVDRAEIARIQATRDSVRAELAAIASDSTAGGETLLATLYRTRIQLLRATDDLLRQRSEALAAGATLSYQEPAYHPDPARAEALARSIKDARDSLALASQRATSLTAGSLTGGLARMQVETQRLSIDMMEMSRLGAVYGIGLPPLKPDSVARTANR